VRERPSSLPGGAATLSSPAISTAAAGGSGMTTAVSGSSSMAAGAVGGSVVSVVVHPQTSGGHSRANKVCANSLYCKLLNS
jgi:hypothetical protein